MKKTHLLFFSLITVISVSAKEITYDGKNDYLYDSELTISDDPASDNRATLKHFKNSMNFTDIEIPSIIDYGKKEYVLTAIGDYAFDKETNKREEITNLVLPETVTSIGTHAFQTMRKLKTITLPRNILFWGTEIFTGCSSLEEVVLPENLEVLPVNSFYGCFSLKTIVVGSSMTKFEGPFNALEKLYIDATTPPEIYKPDFPSHVTVYIPAGTKDLYAEKWGNEKFTYVEVGIPSKVESIAGGQQSATVKSEGGILMVRTEKPVRIVVYTIDGRIVADTVSDDTEVETPAGIYFVKTNNCIQKILHY